MSQATPSIKECWDIYTDGFPSPDKYINWSFYSLISSCLGRRVWYSSDENSLFSNMYPILIGKPGTGKDGPIKLVKSFLKHWKMGDNKHLMGEKLPEHKIATDALIESDSERTQSSEYQGAVKTEEQIRPLLFPVAANATTYEALIQAVCESHRRIQYPKYSEKLQKTVLGTYGHCSIGFQLPELASLLKRRAEDTITYLLETFDCPEDYEYRTKHQGRDRVRRACVNLLGGIQPDIIQDIFSDKVLSSGMSSRMLFIFAAKARKYVGIMPPFTEEQMKCKEAILQHILKLSVLYGRAEVDADTFQWYDMMCKNWQEHPEDRINKSSSLEGYYARKNIHVLKVAMAMHFGESTELFIQKETLKKAIAFIEDEEKFMHLVLDIGVANPLHKVGKRIKQFLTTGEKSKVELMIETEGIASREQLNETLEFLQEVGQIKAINRNNEETGRTKEYWMNV